MPQIIPIRDLKNTSEIALRCKSSNEPIFVTKNGYGEMVIMSMKLYEEQMYMLDVRKKLLEAEAQSAAGKVMDAEESLARVRAKYGV